MDEFRSQSFGYAHSKAVMEGLKAYARLRNSIITESYVYIEKEGETEAFNEMIKVAKQGGRDILYVDSVKEFAGKSLADFKEALTAIEDAGMKVVSRESPFKVIRRTSTHTSQGNRDLSKSVPVKRLKPFKQS